MWASKKLYNISVTLSVMYTHSFDKFLPYQKKRLLINCMRLGHILYV